MLDFKEKIKRNFSRSAENYERYAEMHREIALKLLDKIPTGEYKSILEIGCGTGLFTFPLLEKFKAAEIIAIDIAPGMILKAKAQAKAQVRIKVEVGDGESLTFPDNSFDLVVSSSSLQWMDIKKCFAEVKRVLKPDGKFYFTLFLRHGEKMIFKEMRRAGFKEIGVKSEIKEKQFDNLMGLLKFLKGLGAQASRKKPGFLAREKLFDKSSSVSAVFEVIFGEGSK